MSDTRKTTKPNVPNLRFPGFEGEWARCTLGEIGEPYIGLTYSPADVVSEGGTIVFRSSNIQNGEIDYSDIVRVNKIIKDSIITRKDDLLICARNGSPRLIGKNALLKEADEGQTFGAFMLVFRSNDNHFVHQLLCTKGYNSQVSENLGARINQITTSNIRDFEFCFPQSTAERNKIAGFLDLIDERIAVQSRLIEDLKKLRCAIVEKMFKQSKANGRLGDFIEQVSVRNKNGLYSNVLSVSNKQGFVKQSEQFEDRTVASEDTSNYKIVKRNNFAYNPARINVGSIARLTKFDVGIVSPMYVCFRTKASIIPEYMEAFFTSQQFFYEMMKRLEGSVRLCLSYEGLCNIPVYIPDMNKQIAMGQNISLILSKIGLEIEYLGRLHQQKQYLLRKMFI
jgi:type I restriction enzyme S subunit